MPTWNCRDSTPLSAAPWAPKGDQGWIFWSYKSNYLFSLSGFHSWVCTEFVIVFLLGMLFEMRLFNLRINFIADFCPHLGSFLLFFLLRFGQISPLAVFSWLTATLDRNAESCNHIPSNYCLPKSTIKSILRLRSLISKRIPNKKTSSVLFKNDINKMCLQIVFNIYL